VGTPTLSGGLHGGDEGATAMTFFAVDDIEAALAKVIELGGSRDGYGGDDPPEPTQWGRFAICRDDQGSLFGLHEPIRSR
jgi:predicted enzyme related to lactoylglutathione lyase